MFVVASLLLLEYSSALAFSSASSSRRLMMSATTSASPKNIVVVGGGVQGTSVAFQLSRHEKLPSGSKITLLEAKEIASAASGKGGGFMARSWGDGGPTQKLHHLSFDMYEELSKELKLESYRKLPVLSVSPGDNSKGLDRAKKSSLGDIIPSWLNGNTGSISPLGYGDDTAQVTPKEFVEKMLSNVKENQDNIEVVLGECVGLDTSETDDEGEPIITGVKYKPRGKSDEEIETIEADTIIVAAGPWACAAEDWFGTVSLPMEGVKSTSIVWKNPSGSDAVDPTALFCGEDYRFSTHLEVYPRPDGSIYICGIGGSDYISTEDLKKGAFREECLAKEDRVEAAKNAFKEMSKTYKDLGELDRVQACMRPCPPDARPYLGAIPTPGFSSSSAASYICSGMNCWGIAWAPACGLSMAELVLEGHSKSIDLRPFDPTRFTQKSKVGRGRKRRGESVGEQW